MRSTVATLGYEHPAALHADGTPVERIEDLLRRRAAATPDLVAVSATDGDITFAELDARADRIAQALLRDGIRPGDRVAYLGENSADFLSVLYGAAKAGAVPTALNTRLADREYEYILGDCEPAVVVLGRGHERLAGLVAGLPFGPDVVTVEPISDAAALEAWLADAQAQDPGTARDPDDTALIFYSSGTTGRPKGIELTGTNIGHAMAPMTQVCGMELGSVATAPVPFFHVAGLMLAMSSTVAGSTLLLRNPASMQELRTFLVEERVSHAVLVPTLLQTLLAEPGVRDADWSRLRYVIYGSSPIPRSVITEATQVFGCSFIQSYGLTETTGGVTVLDGEDHRSPDESRLRSAGRAFATAEITVVDPVTLEELPPDTRGEVLVRGPMVMKGYWRNPEATAAAITADGWFRTGDGGSVDAAGYLYLHDRLKDMIVSGGENVYPAEVESVMTGHPEVSQVAVIGIPSDRWGESPLAVVVRRPEGTVDEAGLLAWTRERLAHYKCPVAVAFVDQLPLNATGKLLKHQLRASYATSEVS